MGITFSGLVILFGIIWGRERISQQPLLMFFFISYVMAMVLFVGWGIYWHGLPQFSEVGII